MDDYLGKPVQLHVLEEKLLAWLPQHAAHDNTVAAPAGESLALHGDMLQLLLETSRNDLAAIEQAAAQGHAPVAAQRLHRLLGALQIFISDPALGQAQRRLDDLQGDQPEEALQHLPGDLASLRQLLDRLERPASVAAG